MSTELTKAVRLVSTIGPLIVVFMLMSGSVLSASPDSSDYAERFKAAEKRLAETEQPYFICDLQNSRLRLKIRGIVVRDYRYTPIEDSDLVMSFRERGYAADSVVHALTRVHLYEAAHRLNDTVLGIVSEATKASAELLQRYRPERMVVTFEGRLGFEVLSDVDGGAVSLGSNLAESARELAERALGSRILQLKLDPDSAMSFYGACQSKPPLLLAP